MYLARENTYTMQFIRNKTCVNGSLCLGDNSWVQIIFCRNLYEQFFFQFRFLISVSRIGNNIPNHCPKQVPRESLSAMFRLRTGSQQTPRREKSTTCMDSVSCFTKCWREEQLTTVRVNKFLTNRLSQIDCYESIVTNRLSQIDCHKSIVTNRLSQIDCRKSIVTNRLLQIDCHILIVTNRLSQIDCHISIVTNRLSQIDCHKSIVTNRLSHIDCHKSIVHIDCRKSIDTHRLSQLDCHKSINCHISIITYRLQIDCHISEIIKFSSVNSRLRVLRGNTISWGKLYAFFNFFGVLGVFLGDLEIWEGHPSGDSWN